MRAYWTASATAVILALSFATFVGHATVVSPPMAGSAADRSDSAAALYNLGNAYARQGQPALAVVNYERARILAPLDADIRANLQHVRASAGLAPESTKLGDRFPWTNPNTTYWIGFMGLLVAGVGWLYLCRRHRHRTASRAALGAGLLMMAFTLSDAIAVERIAHRAVVLRPAAASASPIFAGGTIFTEPEAATVQRQEEHGSFTLIRDSSGRVGWVPRSELLPVLNTSGEFAAKT